MKRIALVVAVFAVAAGFADLKVGTTYTIGAAVRHHASSCRRRRRRRADVVVLCRSADLQVGPPAKAWQSRGTQSAAVRAAGSRAARAAGPRGMAETRSGDGRTARGGGHHGRRSRRGRRVVHDAAGAPCRPERQSLRGGHSAPHDRGNQPAHRARGTEQHRQTGARSVRRSQASGRCEAGRGAHRRYLSRDGQTRS